MINVDWSEAPEGAVKRVKVERWMNQYGELSTDEGWSVPANPEAWQTIATRPTERKTVKDAVGSVVTGFEGKALWYSPAKNQWTSSPGLMPSDAYQVCTRDEFEAEVERQKGEWTHTRDTGELCKVLYEDSKCQLIHTEADDGRSVIWHPPHFAKPIPTKPTITKAQAFDKLNAVPGITLEELHDKFIVEGTA